MTLIKPPLALCKFSVNLQLLRLWFKTLGFLYSCSIVKEPFAFVASADPIGLSRHLVAATPLRRCLIESREF